MKSSPAYSAFISYASENRDKADAICAALEGRGLLCWMAPRDVRAGREYADEIILGLERSGAVVLVLSEAANTSVFVLREVERAVAKEVNVVPVRIEEVTPSPGLELFISGTHWLDVWKGDWDVHMDRLVRDLSDDPVGAPLSGSVSTGRSVSAPSPFRRTHVVAGLAMVVVALSGIAIWSFSRATPQVETPVSRGIEPSVQQTTDPGAAIIQVPTATIVEEPRTLETSASVPRRRATSDDRTSRDVTPARGPTAEARPPAVDMSRELDALKNDYDTLSLRGGVIDGALNQLWEDMKPNSPRIDMVTHQRSLTTNLTRSRDALADSDAASARRYLESARGNLAALEQFLNR